MNTTPDLTVNDVAAQLQCSDKKVRRLAKAGTIPAYRLGRDWRFKPSALDVMRARQAVNVPATPSTPVTRVARRRDGRLKGWNKFS